MEEAKIRSLSEDLIQAQVSSDADKLNDILHENFIGVDPDGSVVRKKEEVDGLIATQFTRGSVKHDTIVRENGTTVVVGTADFSKNEETFRFRFTDVFVGGKLISSHATRL